MPSKKLNVRPNSFYVEKQVTNGQMVFDQHGDFSNKTDLNYNINTGKTPSNLLLSGNVDSNEHVIRGRYGLRGGYLRTYVSGLHVADGDGTVPSLQLFGLHNNYDIKEGGMIFARPTSAGTITATNGSTAVSGVGTTWSGTTGFFGKYFKGTNYQGGAYIYIGPNGSKERYEVAAIGSNTALTLSTNYTGTTTSTTQLELDEDMGANVTTFSSVYTGPSVNFEENFDGLDAKLSAVTEITREGANTIVKRQNPYILCSLYDEFKYNVSSVINNHGHALGMQSLKNVKIIMEQNAYYPVRAQNAYDLNSFIGNIENGFIMRNPDGGIQSRNAGTPNQSYGSPSDTAFMNNFNNTVLSQGRLYLAKETSPSPDGQFYHILNRNGRASGYGMFISNINSALIKYDSEQTFDPNPENTVNTTTNNTIFDKVYSSFNFNNPFTATSDVPVLTSTVELQSDVVKSGANAARIYHLWDFSPDNADIEKYLGRDNSLNPQTAYMAKYDIPFPLTQDMSLSRNGDRRSYVPYISMDMNVAKLQPSVLYDIQNYLGSTLGNNVTGNFINDPTVEYSGSDFQSTNFGTTAAIRTKAMTFLRSVVITFSNYKPLDTHTTLEDFLQYGFDNAYGSSQNAESIVGGVVLSRLGMDGADIENEFIYAQALPIVKFNTFQMGFNEMWNAGSGHQFGFGLAKIRSGTADGRLQQMLMFPANIENSNSVPAATPRVVKLPMNEFFNMKFYIDVLQDTGANSNSYANTRNPYATFPNSRQGVAMRCVFQTDAINEESTSEDIYKDMPYLDLNFSVSGGNANPGASTGGSTPGFRFSDFFSTPNAVTCKYPKHMIIWVQNYRFVNSAESQFAFGDNQIIDSASGSAIETEVYIDNVMGCDFYKNIANTTSKGKIPSPVLFPQGELVDSPIRFIEDGSIDMTSFNAGTAVNATDANTTISSYSPASHFCIGFDSKLDLPISGSSTARRGYLLMNDFYTTSFTRLDRIIPDLYSGATISLGKSDYDDGVWLDGSSSGTEVQGSPYASGTVGVNYFDPAVGNAQYSTTGNKDITSKICFGTGSNNNFLSSDGFTQKGFININISNAGNSTSNAYDVWAKRENAFCSTKITDVPRGGNNLATNQLQVADVDVFNPYNENEEYILYQANFEFSGSTFKILTLKGGVSAIGENNIVTFNESVVSGSGVFANAIGRETQLPYLYISPYKYWVNLNTRGDQNYQPRSFTGVTLVHNNLSGASASPSTVTGTTFNEATYTFKVADTGSIGQSASYDSAWNFTLDPEADTALILTQNFGYGAYDTAEKKGGYLSHTTPSLNTYNYMNIGPLLLDSTVQERGNFNLMMRQLPSDYTTNVRLIGDEYASDNQLQFKPTYIYEYLDSTPFINSFTVEPAIDLLSKGTNLYDLSTENLNAIRFNWDIPDDDIWYQMIHIDNNGAIENKYQNAKLWIPMNEEPPNLTTKPTINWYNKITDTSGTAVVGANVRSFVDGLQGYSPHISGNAVESASIRVTNSENDAFKNLTEYTFVIHVTFDATEKGSNTLIFGQGVFNHMIALRKDANDVIQYDHSTSSATSTATGSTVVRCDGETVYSIIVTYRYQSEAGPDLKLYVDGKLDGYVVDAVNKYTGSDHLQFAYGYAAFPPGINYFQGRVEEFVLWDKQFLVVEGNEYIYNTADLDDLTSGKTNTWSAKLFAYDYHNIRGKTFKEVASSQNISWRTTPV